MTSAFDTLDLLLRGGATALNLFVAIQFLRASTPRFLSVAGSLFATSVAAYGLVSNDAVNDALGISVPVLVVPAVLASAFFWWFALALFRDGSGWQWAYAAPPALLLAFYGMRQSDGETLQIAGALLHQVVVISLLVHIVSLALRELRNDLIDSRRQFRVAVALSLPIVGFVIAGTELYGLRHPLPEWLGLRLVQSLALALAILALAFGLWTTAVRQELFVPALSAPQPRTDELGPAELLELQRLRTAISSGVCFEPDLSLAKLARQLGVPEHRLRKLINKGLGYRNFAAFLNDHRITEAKHRLSDPQQAREQIASIAFGLGYASLTPFNRAFRELTGVTPTDYRAQALARHVASGNS